MVSALARKCNERTKGHLVGVAKSGFCLRPWTSGRGVLHLLVADFFLAGSILHGVRRDLLRDDGDDLQPINVTCILPDVAVQRGGCRFLQLIHDGHALLVMRNQCRAGLGKDVSTQALALEPARRSAWSMPARLPMKCGRGRASGSVAPGRTRTALLVHLRRRWSDRGLEPEIANPCVDDSAIAHRTCRMLSRTGGAFGGASTNSRALHRAYMRNSAVRGEKP
mmetsp:Transcript_83864/g.234022  ORF Transcript_83864/g.234022 Transcript_83864/m.234022 type:complete len:223 (+) Transcript_83864:1803-2471(+)